MTSRLHDSLSPRWSRDDLMETRLGLRAWYIDPTAGGAAPAAGSVTPPAAPETPPAAPAAAPAAPQPPPPADDDIVLDGDKLDPEKVKKIIADRNAKGKSEKALKAENEQLRKENEAFKAEQEKARLASLSAEEAAKERATAAEKRAAEEAEARQKLEREIACTRAGIDPDLADVVEAKLKAAQEKDKNLDVTKWFEDRKVSNPKWFGENPPPVHTESGAQRQGAQNNEAQIAQLQKQKEQMEKAGTLSHTERAKIDARIEVLRLG